MKIIKIVFFFSLLMSIFVSCETDVEINVPETVILDTKFQVDFDGETWVADNVSATVLNTGIISMSAFSNNNQEIVIVTLLSDQVGSYIISPDEFLGDISYQDLTDDLGPFITSQEVISGGIDLEVNDILNQILTGKFFFTGSRYVQEFDDIGNPVLDEEGNPVFNEEVKDFTNGIFENIVYTTTIIPDPDPDPTPNEFFVNIDGVEFVEETITGIRSSASGFDIITLTATRNSSNEVIELKIPGDIFNGNVLLYPVAPDPESDASVMYTIVDVPQTFAPADPSDIPTTLLKITSHNQPTNRIEGEFKFFANDINGGPDTHSFTEGTFSVTYTEE